jgi:hypothetical protein
VKQSPGYSITRDMMRRLSEGTSIFTFIILGFRLKTSSMCRFYELEFDFFYDFLFFFGKLLVLMFWVWLQDGLEGEAEVLLDPNELSEDGTVSLNSYTLSVSEDAKYLAYGISKSGSDWVTIKVMRIEDKIVEADTLNWVRICFISEINFDFGCVGYCYELFVFYDF